jgi:hypothetical protein
MQGEIFNEEAGIEKGENARMASFVGAIAIADLVKQVYIKSLTMRSSDYVWTRSCSLFLHEKTRSRFDNIAHSGDFLLSDR